jgi:hypothetical protein
MKKLLLILSIVATTFALTSCGSGFSTEETTATTETEVTETVDTTVTETAETATAETTTVADTVSAN